MFVYVYVSVSVYVYVHVHVHECVYMLMHMYMHRTFRTSFRARRSTTMTHLHVSGLAKCKWVLILVYAVNLFGGSSTYIFIQSLSPAKRK